MRRLVMVFLAMVALALPANALEPTLFDDAFTGTPGMPGFRSNDCPGEIVWDVGMYDDWVPPAGCATAFSSTCFVNALNDGGFPEDGRRGADDFVADGRPITHIKIWGRYNQQGYDSGRRVLGFCVKFYVARDVPDPWCPDGSVAGELAIGDIVYSEYVNNFVEYEIPGPLDRNFNYCMTLPAPFYNTAGTVYWVSVSADYDFTSFGGGVTQWFWRVYEGWGYNPYCEASWWDTWNSPGTNWNAVSIGVSQPCWTGYDAAFVLYAGEAPPPPLGACCVGEVCAVTSPTECQGEYQGDGTDCEPNPCIDPVSVEEKSWGRIKVNFR